MAILRRSNADGGDWTRCPACEEILPESRVHREAAVCPSCGYHHPIDLARRMALLLDADSFQPAEAQWVTTDLLRFKGKRRYKDQLAAARKATGAVDSVHAGKARIEGHAVAVAFVDGDFLAGSLGCVAAERICGVLSTAATERIPAVVVTCGARLRHAEGAVGMSQLARLAATRQRLQECGGLFLSVIVAPLPTGAACAFAYSGDVNLAEPGVGDPDRPDDDPPLTGDALAATGLVDRVVQRTALKAELAQLMELLA